MSGFEVSAESVWGWQMQIDLLVRGAELCHRSGSKQFVVGGGGGGGWGCWGGRKGAQHPPRIRLRVWWDWRVKGDATLT